MRYVNVYLFSEMTDEGQLQALQYHLTAEEMEALYYSVEHDLKIIAFGDHFHHSDDIIRFDVLPSTDQQYKNM